MQSTSKRIIFLHLPKNAGTSMYSILKRNYSAKEIYHVRYNKNGIWNLDEFKKLPQNKKDKIYLLTGHFDFGLHEYFSHQFQYVTMMRNPIERTISFYNYIKSQ